MNTGVQELPAWLVILGCGFGTQLSKLLVYSLTQRRLAVGVLGQSYGVPSLTASVLTCLLVLVTMRQGWNSSQAGFALVFAVIAVHDTIKLRVAASRQRQVVFKLVESLDDVGPFHLRVADYLDPRTHHPAHVATGVLFGSLFALAFGLSSG
jgi:acid phosphatase family membrane protein YuiD